MKQWHSMSVEEALSALTVESGAGLSDSEVERRSREHGPNQLVERPIKSMWLILWEQLTAVMVVILIIAALLSLFLGEINDAIAIIVIVVLNAILGLRQEYRAEKAMAALNKLAVPQVRVRRSGSIQQVSAQQIVPGDVVLLEAGSHVPADCRIIEAANLSVEEATLTGESLPVEKTAQTVFDVTTPMADRRNLLYMGTSVTYGRGACVVTETGMKTELGAIAEMIQSVDRSPTPLQVRLDSLGKTLAVVAFVLVVLIFCLGLWREGPSHLRELFLVAVSMAVAAVPEGLPAVVTIALALGAQRMLNRHALIRKLLAVEALGSVTVICSDKTGTLTENRMALDGVFANKRQYNSAALLKPAGERALTLTLAGGAICNDSEMCAADSGTSPGAIGDPTETALLVAADAAGLRKADLEKALPRVGEAPFDSDRKRMTTLHRVDDADVLETIGISCGKAAAYIGITKGAVDGLAQICDTVDLDGDIVALDTPLRATYRAASEGLASQGMRVLGVAYRVYEAMPSSADATALECGLTFAGMLALLDPPRQEVKAAVELCKTAGIRPIMVSGDHPLTAQHIASELGISVKNGRAVTGTEIASMKDDELVETLKEVSVFARVTPETKLEIVTALQKQGHIVAMTGDGVNDAPALKKANIGVAMGIVGTDVAKQASDMVLLDDNFATIVAAVAEGRTIYDNIRKFIKYLMSTNSGELWVMITAPLLGMPLPLLPLQILWMNLVTDGLPALALGVEPPERNVMRRKPTQPRESIFAHGMGVHIIWVGLVMAVISLGIGWWYWRHEPAIGEDATRWQTMVFTVLTLSQMAHVLAIRSGSESLFSVGILSNKPLLIAVSATIGLQFMLIYVPFFQSFFRTVSLSLTDMIIALAMSSILFWLVETEKAVIRRMRRRKFTVAETASAM